MIAHGSAPPPPTARSRCSPLKVLFYGTPSFALPAFEAVRDAHTIVAVVTQPDRRPHRGQKLTPPPVKVAARSGRTAGAAAATAARSGVARGGCARSAPTWPWSSPSARSCRSRARRPARCSINIHGSLLRKYRGRRRSSGRSSARDNGPGSRPPDGRRHGHRADLLTADTPIGPEETAGRAERATGAAGAAGILDTLARARHAARDAAARRGARWPPRPDRRATAPSTGGVPRATSSTSSAAATRGRRHDESPPSPARSPIWRGARRGCAGPPARSSRTGARWRSRPAPGRSCRSKSKPESRRAVAWDEYLARHPPHGPAAPLAFMTYRRRARSARAMTPAAGAPRGRGPQLRDAAARPSPPRARWPSRARARGDGRAFARSRRSTPS